MIEKLEKMLSGLLAAKVATRELMTVEEIEVTRIVITPTGVTLCLPQPLHTPLGVPVRLTETIEGRQTEVTISTYMGCICRCDEEGACANQD